MLDSLKINKNLRKLKMIKSKFITYSALLLSSILIIGCSSSAEITKDKKDITNKEQPKPNVDNNETNNTAKSISYKIDIELSQSYQQKGYYGREEIGEINFKITDTTTNASADLSLIESITLATETSPDANGILVGKYLDFVSYDGSENSMITLPSNSIKVQNSIAFKTKDLADTANITITVKLKANVSAKNSISEVSVPIIIKESSISHMSIIPIGSRYENGLFIDKFLIHAVDNHGNKAADGTKFTTGTINNVKLYSNAYNGYRRNYADITNPNSPDPFVDNDQILPKDENERVITTSYSKSMTNEYFQDIVILEKNDKATINRTNSLLHLSGGGASVLDTGDTLILLANRDENSAENMGAWSIGNILSTNTLQIENILANNEAISGLSYVIGDKFRFDECSGTTMNTAISSLNSSEIVDGIAYAELRYEPSMVGKNLFIYANSRVDGKHIGTSRKVLLKGTGVKTQSVSCSNIDGSSPECSVDVRMIQNDSGKIIQESYISNPLIIGNSAYKATLSRTDCNGIATLKMYGIKPNQSATVNVGEFISNEIILNKN